MYSTPKFILCMQGHYIMVRFSSLYHLRKRIKKDFFRYTTFFFDTHTKDILMLIIELLYTIITLATYQRIHYSSYRKKSNCDEKNISN